MAELSVDIDVNTGPAVSNVKKLGESFSDAARELLEIVDAGKRAGKSTEDIARDISKKYDVAFDDAKDGVDKLDRALDEMRRTGDVAGRDASDSLGKVERAAKDAEDAVDDIGGNSFRRLKETSAEVGDEIRQNLGEGLANAARGDFEGLADVIGDTLGGATASIGGIGTAAAAAAGAAGLGLVIAAIQTSNAEAEKLRERLSSAYLDALDAGSEYITQQQVIAELRDLMFNSDRLGEYNRLLEDQKTLGLDLETLAGANIGRQEDLATVQERINTLKQQGSDIDRGSDSILGNIDTNLAGIANRWADVQAETDKQKQKVAELESAEARLSASARDQINRTADTAAARYSALARQYGVPIEGVVKMRVDTSAWDNYVPRFKTGVIAVNVRTGINQLG